VDLDPRSPTALARLGLASWHLGQHGEAARAWSEALAVDPANSLANEGLARLALETGDSGAATSRLDAVTSAADSLRLARVHALLARGQPGDGPAALELALASAASETDDDLEAQYLLGSAQIAAGRFGDAQATFEALASRHPAEAFGAYGLARLAAAQNRATDALLNLQAAHRVSGSGWNASQVAADPAFSFISSTPEFKALVGK